jgi:membrane complex biogenesis BtpA family protein
LFSNIHGNSKTLIGMVHLPSLPGTANYDGKSFDQICTEAVSDACTLQEAGFDGILLQNSNDVPSVVKVGHETTAFMSTIAYEIKKNVSLPLGIDVEKNDAHAALAIAAATGGAFVRLKVYTGAVISHEGVIEGCAADALQERSRLNLKKCQIWADVFDITSVPIGRQSIAEAAHWALQFGAADALIITGHTFTETINHITKVREVHPEAKIVVGGGIKNTNVREVLQIADGVIVGSALVEQPFIGPICSSKAFEFLQSARW